MTSRTREAMLALVAIALLGGAIAIDLGRGEARLTPAGGLEAPFVGRALFCSPRLEQAGASGTITAGSGFDRGRLAVEPLPDNPPGREAKVWSGPARSRPQAVVGRRAPAYAGAAATLSRGRKRGVGAGRCAAAASTRWYFPAGTTAIGHDERIMLYNPFPEEAVVRITLFTPASDILKSGLADVAVPARGTRTVRLDRVVVPRAVLGAEISAVRGRVVAWKSILSRPREGARGMSLSLGSTEVAPRWFLAYGFSGSHVRESVSILNPSDRELTVTVSLAGKDRAAQPAELIDVSIAPRSTRRLRLDAGRQVGSEGQMVGVSATVSSTNGVEFVAEREVGYGSARGDGITSELGAAAAARSWLLTPPVSEPERDALALLNPTARDGRVDVVLRSKDGVRRPKALQGLKIGAGLRLEVALQRWSSGPDPVVALVTADVAVVAERYARSAEVPDRADIAGWPLPSAPR